ncbi:RluA family pseudouridine synthase [Mycoplasma miroungirhinis]|uniref:Pseudouridine synthase n=1 Tax=Mycoplasma miroungirhinis TaxID=754516 RepID=A0A6M4JAG9_9MOLU|nr:RluA family pseudouridine synthase [Mycoplasma miroungirhinis]QJR43890.1 RluA family pseudouridine synthase [Mycoplasma miroungirhinis]
MIKLAVKYSERIDKYITNNSEITRNDAQELIRQGAVSVDGMKINKTKFIVSENQEILIEKLIDKTVHIDAQNITLNIVYEDDKLIVINKESGMVTHPAPGNYKNTLVNALMYHFKNNLSNENGLLRLGIVHRLDKDTSGLLLVAKDNKTHQFLAAQLKDHKIDRKYLAIVDGIIENEITNIDLPIGRDPKNRQKMAVTKTNSKLAQTRIKVLKQIYVNNSIKTLVECQLKTGRTHQIRVHLAYIKHPVFGDPLYGKKEDSFNQRLHAYKITFKHPNGKIMTFEIPMPLEMQKDINVSELNL